MTSLPSIKRTLGKFDRSKFQTCYGILKGCLGSLQRLKGSILSVQGFLCGSDSVGQGSNTLSSIFIGIKSLGSGNRFSQVGLSSNQRSCTEIGQTEVVEHHPVTILFLRVFLHADSQLAVEINNDFSNHRLVVASLKVFDGRLRHVGELTLVGGAQITDTWYFTQDAGNVGKERLLFVGNEVSQLLQFTVFVDYSCLCIAVSIAEEALYAHLILTRLEVADCLCKAE